MKPDIHTDSHPVVFQDATTGATFLTRSSLTSLRTIEWQTPNGVETYPLVVVEVTSDSHPFWTGARRILDTAGQVENRWRSSTAATATAVDQPAPSSRGWSRQPPASARAHSTPAADRHSRSTAAGLRPVRRRSVVPTS